jgi:hypothetical protein
VVLRRACTRIVKTIPGCGVSHRGNEQSVEASNLRLSRFERGFAAWISRFRKTKAYPGFHPGLTSFAPSGSW